MYTLKANRDTPDSHDCWSVIIVTQSSVLSPPQSIRSVEYGLTKANQVKAWDAKLLAYVSLLNEIWSQGCRAYPFKDGDPVQPPQKIICFDGEHTHNGIS
jgi:hypothetical protein